jgi:hypothetical protein
VLAHGPVAPLSQQAIVLAKEKDRRVDEPNLKCCDPADDDPIDDDTKLARLSGTGMGAGGEIACIAAVSQQPYDWASLCDDARHRVGATEALHLNDRCDGIGDDLSADGVFDGAPLNSVDLALTTSRFAGPRPACVVSERNPVGPESGRRPIAVAGAIFRCSRAIAEHLIAGHETAVLATVRAARRSAGQAIGVGLSSCFATPDCAARLWLEQPPPTAGTIRL